MERRADFDADAFARTVGRNAQVRQLFEAVSFRPTALTGVKNAFNGLQFGFGYPASAIAIALAAHGPSAAYGYSDELWTRYRIGETFKLTDSAGAPISSNVFLARRTPIDQDADPDDDRGMYQDSSIEMLQHRGLVVLICHTAVEEQARALHQRGIAPAAMTATAIADDILTHLIPAALVVPSMVATIGVLQSAYRYAYVATGL